MEPRLRIVVSDWRPETAPGQWRVGWLLSNFGSEPVSLEAAWIPHGKFRGKGRLALGGDVGAGASTRLEFSVFVASEEPGSVVENAFLILRVDSQGQQWRIFARMRIEYSASNAEPRPIVEVVTLQSIE